MAQEGEKRGRVQRQRAVKSINVCTKEPLGAQSSEREFGTCGLSTVDGEQLQNACSFDSSGLTDGLDGAFDLSSLGASAGGSLDLSGMIDLSGIQLDLPQAPSLSMSDIMDSIESTASQADISQMVSGLLAGYQEYAA